MKTTILYEDQDIFVCYKPAGFAVQSARPSQMDMESELRGFLHGAQLHVVHRLDQPVEGLLVFAKNKTSATKLGAQAQSAILNKHYRALVCGKMLPDSGKLVDELIKKQNGVGEVVTEKVRSGVLGQQAKQSRSGVPGQQIKHAELSYQVLSYQNDTDVSDVEIHLITGRFHQIRLQFAHAGHPLAGDRKYGGETAAARGNMLGISGVALCAHRLVLRHPRTGREMDFSVTPSFIRAK